MTDAEKIEEAIREKIKKPKGKLTKANLKKVTEINLSDNKLTDVSVLKRLEQLTELNLSDNQITDLTPLAELKELESLKLGATRLSADYTSRQSSITDVSALKELTQLTNLDLSGNQISDVSPLAGLTKLTKLNLSNNNITDLTPLAELKKLEFLCLGEYWVNPGGAEILESNQITDLKPLQGLKNLRKLTIYHYSFRKGCNHRDPDYYPSRVEIDTLQAALPQCSILTVPTAKQHDDMQELNDRIGAAWEKHDRKHGYN